MRTVDAAGKEERLAVFLLQLRADPFRHFHIAAELLVADIERMPVGFHILPWPAAWQRLRPLTPGHVRRERILRFLRREVFVPRTRVDEVV